MRQEFSWQDVCGPVAQLVTMVIAGPTVDERSGFFPNCWRGISTPVLELSCRDDFDKLWVSVGSRGQILDLGSRPLFPGLFELLSENRHRLTVPCLDLTSLQHPLLMYLVRLILEEVRPKKLFATYAQPVGYRQVLTREFLGIRPVPGFAGRSRQKDVRLLAFLGFEGDRLLKIMEHLGAPSRVTPVVGFPPMRPGWQAVALRNSQRTVEASESIGDIQQCPAASVFAAYDLVARFQPDDAMTYVLSPLGTRPHTMACALYATKYPGTRLVYDYPVEVAPRTDGVGRSSFFNLSPFLLT